VFAIAAALGGVSGLLVGMYYNSIDPNMGFHAGLKGSWRRMIRGMGNVPGAIAGSLLLAWWRATASRRSAPAIATCSLRW